MIDKYKDQPPSFKSSPRSLIATSNAMAVNKIRIVSWKGIVPLKYFKSICQSSYISLISKNKG